MERIQYQPNASDAFSQILKQADGLKSGRTIGFTAADGLYTGSKVSASKVNAFLSSDADEARSARRLDAGRKIFEAVRTQYGPQVAEAMQAKFKATFTKESLQTLANEIKAYQLETIEVEKQCEDAFEALVKENPTGLPAELQNFFRAEFRPLAKSAAKGVMADIQSILFVDKGSRKATAWIVDMTQNAVKSRVALALMEIAKHNVDPQVTRLALIAADRAQASVPANGAKGKSEGAQAFAEARNALLSRELGNELKSGLFKELVAIQRDQTMDPAAKRAAALDAFLGTADMEASAAARLPDSARTFLKDAAREIAKVGGEAAARAAVADMLFNGALKQALDDLAGDLGNGLPDPIIKPLQEAIAAVAARNPQASTLAETKRLDAFLDAVLGGP